MFSDLSSLTGYFKVLADETRVKILRLLSMHELTVGELVLILEMNQSAVSNQLAALKKGDYISGRKEGNRVYYSLASDFENSSRYPLFKETVITKGSSKLFTECDAGLKAVLEQRRQASVSFFEELEEKEVSADGQISPVSTALARMISSLSIVDMGCGSGDLALLLAKSGNSVIGIDNSQKRISQAKERLILSKSQEQNTNTGSVQFINTNIEESGLSDKSAERVIFSQTLHHIADPQAAISEAYRILSVAGRIVIIDLAAYDNEKTKEEMGDFWMGFSKENLTTMLSKAGFSSILIEEIEDSGNKHGKQTLVASAERSC